MKTIGERLVLLLAQFKSLATDERNLNEVLYDVNWYNKDATQAAIVEDWNVALGLLRRALLPIKSKLYELCQTDDTHIHYIVEFGDEEWPDTILCREIEMHIAKMEGTDA